MSKLNLRSLCNDHSMFADCMQFIIQASYIVTATKTLMVFMLLLYLILIWTLCIYLVEHLEHWLSSDRSCDLVYPDCALETEVESKMWKFLLTRINLLQRAYPTTLEVSSHKYSDVTVHKFFLNLFCPNNEPDFWNNRKTISVCVNFSGSYSLLGHIRECGSQAVQWTEKYWLNELQSAKQSELNYSFVYFILFYFFYKCSPLCLVY